MVAWAPKPFLQRIDLGETGAGACWADIKSKVFGNGYLVRFSGYLMDMLSDILYAVESTILFAKEIENGCKVEQEQFFKREI